MIYPFHFSPSDMAVNPYTNKIYLANNKDWSVTIINDKGDNATTIKLNIPPESLVVILIQKSIEYMLLVYEAYFFQG